MAVALLGSVDVSVACPERWRRCLEPPLPQTLLVVPLLFPSAPSSWWCASDLVKGRPLQVPVKLRPQTGKMVQSLVQFNFALKPPAVRATQQPEGHKQNNFHARISSVASAPNAAWWCVARISSVAPSRAVREAWRNLPFRCTGQFGRPTRRRKEGSPRSTIFINFLTHKRDSATVPQTQRIRHAVLPACTSDAMLEFCQAFPIFVNCCCLIRYFHWKIFLQKLCSVFMSDLHDF